MIKSTAVNAALSIMALATFGLTACSQAVPPEEAAGTAITATSLPEACKDHYLLAAMPEAKTIAGKTLSDVSCQSFSITMGYGPELDRVSLQLTDTKAPVTELQGAMAKMAAAGQKATYDATKMAIGLTKGVRQMAIEAPGGVAALGGEDYLSVIMDRADGEIVIGIEPKDQNAQPALMGLLKDRYVFNVQLGAAEIDGAAAAQAAYQPWLSAMRLNALP
jgi:hypothetical protein